MSKLKFVDAFAGIGGFHYGIEEALGKDNVECVAFIEQDKDAIETYKNNHDYFTYHTDITQTHGDQVPEHDLLCGGFPCQAFSINKQNSKKSTVDKEDERSYLYKDLARIVEAKQPKYLLFENVKNLASIKHEKGGLLIDDIVKTFDEVGYNLEYKVYDAADFGVPQQRKRVYLVGKRKDLNEPIVFPEPTESRVTLKSVLEESYDESLLEKFNKPCTSRCALKSEYQGDWSDDGNFDWSWDKAGCYYCNKSNKEDNTVYKWVKKKKGNATHSLEKTDIDKKDVVWQNKQHAFEQDIKDRNNDTKKYKKKTKLGIEPMSIIMYDTPSAVSRQHERIYSVEGISRTLATFGHPVYYIDGKYRKLSSRESARCQGFPEEFEPNENHGKACRQFGNAVCVKVIKFIVEHNFKEN